ncbi:MAG: hypothetical protein RI985_937 [Chloroflexota bacterium]|jgi:glycosyltransferase involved in cell wall biosynthesis
MTNPKRVSLVCTVRDEEDNIAQLIESMIGQSLAPDEVVINDCNSQDATTAIVQQYIDMGFPIRLIVGGHNIPSGRNNAIFHATGDIVACTDAGLILDRHWLKRLVAPLLADEADVAAGFFRPLPRSVFELAIGSTNYREANEIIPEQFMPFGKSVAFRKAVWEQVDGYPEWASHCEDLLFDFALKNIGARFIFVPGAIVHFRPRSTIKQFYRQYVLYARGDAVGGLWLKRHLLRYAVYLFGVLLLLAGGFGWAILASGMVAYCIQPWHRLWLRHKEGVNGWQSLLAGVLVPGIRVIGDVAKMIGYPMGWWTLYRKPQLLIERNQWRATYLTPATVDPVVE